MWNGRAVLGLIEEGCGVDCVEGAFFGTIFRSLLLVLGFYLRFGVNGGGGGGCWWWGVLWM